MERERERNSLSEKERGYTKRSRTQGAREDRRERESEMIEGKKGGTRKHNISEQGGGMVCLLLFYAKTTVLQLL